MAAGYRSLRGQEWPFAKELAWVFFANSLRAKTVSSALVPIALVLVVVAIIAVYAYGRVDRRVVQQRDNELARVEALANVSADRLLEGLSSHSLILQNIAAGEEIRSLGASPTGFGLGTGPAPAQRFRCRDNGLPQRWHSPLLSALYPLSALYSQPFTPKRLESDFPGLSQLVEVSGTLRPAFSNVFTDEVSGQKVILIGVPIIGRGTKGTGMLAGLSSLRFSILNATYAEVLEITAGRQGFAYLVDGTGRVIYHRDTTLLGTDLAATEPVMQVVRGREGAAITEDHTGERLISGFARVPGTGWGVITQDRWADIVGPIRSYGGLLIGLLVAGGVLSGVLIYFAIGRVLKPIKELTSGARRVAAGDFDHTITATTGDEVQALAQQFNTMASALNDSYTGLERMVEERSEDVRESEERYRSLPGVEGRDFHQLSRQVYCCQRGRSGALRLHQGRGSGVRHW